jgi:hypothetical protein
MPTLKEMNRRLWGVGEARTPTVAFYSCGGLFQRPARGPAGNLSRRVPVGQSARFWPSLGHPVPRSCLVRGALTGAIPRLWSGRHFPATPLGPMGGQGRCVSGLEH